MSFPLFKIILSNESPPFVNEANFQKFNSPFNWARGGMKCEVSHEPLLEIFPTEVQCFSHNYIQGLGKWVKKKVERLSRGREEDMIPTVKIFWLIIKFSNLVNHRIHFSSYWTIFPAYQFEARLHEKSILEKNSVSTVLFHVNHF